MHTFKTTALLAVFAVSPAAAFAADLDYYEPAPRPVLRTETRVLPPIVERTIVEQPIIREQVVRRVVRPAPVVVERRIVEEPVVVRRPAYVETYAAPVYRRPRVVYVEPHRGWGGPWGGPGGRPWREHRHAWGGGYAGAHW